MIVTPLPPPPPPPLPLPLLGLLLPVARLLEVRRLRLHLRRKSSLYDLVAGCYCWGRG